MHVMIAKAVHPLRREIVKGADELANLGVEEGALAPRQKTSRRDRTTLPRMCRPLMTSR